MQLWNYAIYAIMQIWAVMQLMKSCDYATVPLLRSMFKAMGWWSCDWITIRKHDHVRLFGPEIEQSWNLPGLYSLMKLKDFQAACCREVRFQRREAFSMMHVFGYSSLTICVCRAVSVHIWYLPLCLWAGKKESCGNHQEKQIGLVVSLICCSSSFSLIRLLPSRNAHLPRYHKTKDAPALGHQLLKWRWLRKQKLHFPRFQNLWKLHNGIFIVSWFDNCIL